MSDHGATELLAVVRGALARAGVSVEPDRDPHWLRVQLGPVPSQGWKLHIAAWPTNGVEVLRACVDVLVRHRTTFKTTTSLVALTEMDQAAWGESQIGKFITVYPADDAAAVQLAIELDAATEGFIGPDVPTDRHLHPGSIVSYRYGGMGAGLLMQTPLGMTVPTIVGIDGVLRPDVRNTRFVAPEGIDDPFLAALGEHPVSSRPRVVGGRWAPLALIHRSPRSTVQLGFDLVDFRRCVLKRATDRHVPMADGTGPRARVRAEARLLAEVASSHCAPAVWDCVELDDETILVMEDLGATTLEQDVRLRIGFASTVTVDEVCAVGRE